LPDDIPDAHWRTLVGDTFSEKFPEQASLEDVKDSYLLCIEFHKILKAGAATHSRANLNFEKGIKYNWALGMAALSRHFFSTVNGHVGLGPPGIKGDDVVCVFYSGGPLYILKFEEDDGAKLIGDAYVHGLMKEGQAFESQSRGADELFLVA